MLPIAIIGAGLAGLSCAAELQRAGHAVLVLEKSRAVGGRLARRRLGPCSVDLGAQYCTAYTPAFRMALQEWQDAGLMRLWQPHMATSRTSPAPAPDSPTQVDKQLEHDVSTRQPQRWVGTPSMRALAEHLAQGVPVRLQTRVAPLPPAATQDGPIHLQDVEGHFLGTFQRVLIATPAEQAAALLLHRPAAAAIAAQVHSLPCIALGVRLAAESTATAAPPQDARFADGQRLSWLAAEHSKPGRNPAPCWIFHAAAAWSAAHFDLADEPLTRALLAEGLHQAGLGAANVLETTVHRWRYARSTAALQLGAWLAPEGRVGLAGDWLAGDRVEGAWSSGRHLARQVLDRV